MNRIEDLEERLNKDNDITRFIVMRWSNPVLYTDSMWFSMNEITKVEKILNEFGLKIHAIGANLDAHGMYIETEKESLDEVWFHSVKIEDLHYGVVCSVCGSLVIDLKSHGKWHVEGGH